MSQLGGAINVTEVTRASFFVTYTPTITGIGGTVASSHTLSRYIQLGKLVYVEYYILLDTVGGGVTGFTVSAPFRMDNYQGSLFTAQWYMPVLQGTYGAALPGKSCFAHLNVDGNFHPMAYDGTNIAVLNNQIVLNGWYMKQ